MIKRLAGILLFGLLLALSLTALACAEDTLVSLYDAGTALLFSTDNVTVTVDADFALDGTLFKQMTAKQVQCGEDMYRDLLLRTPQADGSMRESGYIIVVSDDCHIDYERTYQVLDLYQPVIGRTSLLRSSVGTQTLVSLGRGIAAQLDAALPQNALTAREDGWQLALTGDDVPETVPAVLTLLLQEYAYFREYLDYRTFSLQGYADIADYTTTAEGILYCTKNIRLTQLDASVSQDAQGRLTGVNGTVRLGLETRVDTVHELTVDFTVTVSDYGTSELPQDVLPEDALSDALKSSAMMALTEVYGYTQEEADAFVFETEGMTLCCYPAAHPDWKYQLSNSVLYTPFYTEYEDYPGEAAVRDFLLMAKNGGWLTEPTAEKLAALQNWLELFGITPNEALQTCLEDEASCTPERFLPAYFQSCYGPEENWPAALTQWRDAELAGWVE